MGRYFMSRLYTYIAKECDEDAKKYLFHLKDEKAAVFFIGKDTDIVSLKRELNYIVSKGLDLCCVFFAENEFDQGIEMQLGLATKITDNDNSIHELNDFFERIRKEKKKKALPIVFAIIVLLIAVVIIIPFVNKPKNIIKVESVDNIKLDDIYLKAFIDAGADSIVVDGGISKEELEQITALNLSGLGIDNLKPLLYAINLIELDISDNNIEDITDIVALGKLERINLSGNPIKDYKVLEYLTNIKTVIK